mgnify:CR=1 FL=1
MANEGLQAVLRTLRSIARASGRVSIVIMILLMLVRSLCKLCIAHGAKFVGEDDVGSAQKVQFLFVRGDGVQGSCKNLA